MGWHELHQEEPNAAKRDPLDGGYPREDSSVETFKASNNHMMSESLTRRSKCGFGKGWKLWCMGVCGRKAFWTNLSEILLAFHAVVHDVMIEGEQWEDDMNAYPLGLNPEAA